MTDFSLALAARDTHIKAVGYVRVTAHLVAALLPYCPFVEIGAGTGALSQAIRDAGGRATATDAFLSHGDPDWWGSRGRVIRATATRAASLVARRQGINLLCSWPNYAESWCREAVELLPAGRVFAYIGEGWGGCTGDDALHDLLDEKFQILEEIDVSSFDGVHDSLYIYQKCP